MGTGAATPAAPRGAAVGLVTAAGAVWAHHVAGGTVGLLPGTVAVLASVAAGGLLARGRRPASVGTVVLLAGATQAVWHLLFASTATAGHGAMGHPASDLMLLTHVGAGLLSVALALGADRALLALARGALVTPPMPAGAGLPEADDLVVWTPLGRRTARPVAPYGARGPPRAEVTVRARTLPVWSHPCPRPARSRPASPVS